MNWQNFDVGHKTLNLMKGLVGPSNAREAAENPIEPRAMSMAADLPELPEVRDLEDPELNELRSAAKYVEDDIVFRDDRIHPVPGRKWVANVDVYVTDPSSLSFRVSSIMELELRVNIAGEQDFWYRVKATRQVVNMYHKSPGHLEGGVRIDGPHKHRFDKDNRKRPGYEPDPPPRSDIRDAVMDFLQEENIEFDANFRPPRRTATLDSFDGGLL